MSAERDRFQITMAVFAVIRDEQGGVLLQRREHTGYMDGFYDVPSGHIDAGEGLREAMVREAAEEVGLDILVEDLELKHIIEDFSQDYPYINFLFHAKAWTGVPVLNEPDKHADLRFFALNDLPKITPQVRSALSHLDEPGVSYTHFTPENFQAMVDQT